MTGESLIVNLARAIERARIRRDLHGDGSRTDFILRMAMLAAREPERFWAGDDLVTRTMHYAGSAYPEVTRTEVENALAGILP